MGQAILNGIILGFVISVLIGPVFFLLIQVSLKEGFRSAMALDAGIILSDAFCIAISWFGMAALLENPRNKFIFTIVGSGILMLYGVSKFFPKKGNNEPGKGMTAIKITRSNPFSLAGQGFFYNLINPSTLLFWLTTVGGAVNLYENDRVLIFSQFGATLVIVLGVDLLKAWFAKKMRGFVTPEKMVVANKILGGIFIVFGIILIIRLILEK